MIVNYTAAGWKIITQRAHGLLASQICAYWKKENQPARWIETLVATAEHDDAYNEFEKKNLLEENGGPINFKDVPFEQDHWEYLLHKAHTKSRYIGLLVAHHIRFTYGGFPEAKDFCSKLLKKEKDWLAEARTSTSEIAKSYSLLEFCDAFSLLICQDLIQPRGRKMEISKGPDGRPYEVSEGKNGELIVSPWPFEPNSFKVFFESRTVNQLAFAESEEFRKKLFANPVELHERVIARG